MSDEIIQKISWDNYTAELRLMSIKTKEAKKRLISEAKKSGRWSSIINYPATVLLTITASGGGVQILSEDKSDKEWITTLNTIITIIVIILVKARDTFNFDKKREKYLMAAKAMDTFHELVRFQSFQVKGTEGDRYEVLINLKEMYAEIVQNNQIIQMIESVSGAITPDQMESQCDSEYSTVSDEISELCELKISSDKILELEELKTAENSPKKKKSVEFDDDEMQKIQAGRIKSQRLAQTTNDRNRMFYLNKMLNDIN